MSLHFSDIPTQFTLELCVMKLRTLILLLFLLNLKNITRKDTRTQIMKTKL